jgi:hypothetical protein
MANGIRHAFVSEIPDGIDTTKVRPSDFNADHVGGAELNPDASQRITAQSGGVTPLILKGAASQTEDYFTIEDSSGNVLLAAEPNADGTMRISKGITGPQAMLHVFQGFTAPPTDVNLPNVGIMAHVKARGVRSVSHQSHAFRSYVYDDEGVVNKTISNAVNNGAGLIRITTSTAHTFSTGDRIAVYGVGGTTEANGAWEITVINTTTFDLVGSTFTNAYTSGGTATNRPYLAGMSVTVAPIVDRGGLTGTAEAGDDVGGVVVSNAGSGKATDGFYLSNTGPAGYKWFSGITIDASVERAVQLGAHQYEYGLYLADGTYVNAPIYLPNNSPIAAKKAGGTLQNLLKLNASDLLEFLASIQGLPFPATAVASADPNTQDDYEEGTFNMGITFVTPGNLAVTYSAQGCKYTKIGDAVLFVGRVATSTFTHTTASGNLNLTGFPFVSSSTYAGRIACIMSGWTKASYTQLMAFTTGGATTGGIVASGSGQPMSNIAAADMPSGGTVDIRIGGVYFI